MHIYEFIGDGLDLGAVIVVRATSEEEALSLAKQWAEANVVPPDSLQLVKTRPALESEVVFGWNGAY